MTSHINKHAKIGDNVHIGFNTIIEDGVEICDDCYIEENVIIRKGTKLGVNSKVGANCILGEHLMDFYSNLESSYCLEIGRDCLIRSGSIIYSNSKIGNHFQTGHHATIRENCQIGNNVSVGTYTDIQGHCQIGNYVRFHSNVFVTQHSIIDDYVWIFPHVVFTDDPIPPSNYGLSIHIHSYASVAAGSLLLPGIELGEHCLIAAGAVVTKDVPPYKLAIGNPARIEKDVRDILDKETGKKAYPWPKRFSRTMPWDKK